MGKNKQTLTVPHWAPDEIKAVWNTWSFTQQDYWKNNNRPGGSITLPPAEAGEEAPKLPEPGTIAKSPDGRIVAVYTDKPVTEWDRDMMLEGKFVPAQRIRYAILELIEKNEWYAANMSNGLVERMLAKVLADSTPGWEPPEADPLIVERIVRIEGEDIRIREISHDPRNDEERQRIRKRFGVNSVTIKRLTKKDCKKCKGTGYYMVSSYPGQGRLEKLSDTITCECVFE